MDSSKVGELRGPLPMVDLEAKKRENLVEFALRKKMMAIVDIVNSRTPFEIVKDLSLCSALPIQVEVHPYSQLRNRRDQQLGVLPPTGTPRSL